MFVIVRGGELKIGSRLLHCRGRNSSLRTGVSSALMATLLLNWQIELELGWKFFFRIQPVRKVDSSYPAVGVNLHLVVDW